MYRYPLHIPSVDKWYPIHIPSLQLASLLTGVTVLSFKYKKISKPERFLDFFYSHTMHLFLFGPFYQPKRQISQPLLYFNKWNPYPFIYLKPEKGTGQTSSEKPILLSRRISLTGQFWLLVSALRFKCKKKIIAVTDGTKAVMKNKPKKNSGLPW